MNMRGRWWVFLLMLSLGGAIPATQPSVEFPAVNDPALPNAHVVNAKVICGGQPEGDAGFEKLEAMGVKTVISVDGITPNVEAAHRHGMRYVHLPFGYDGVPDARGEEIAKAIAELPGPVYVHCHHGQHRAPAAAAVACVMNGMLPAEAAKGMLQVFGTGKNYVGLGASAREAKRLDPAVLKGLNVHFVETAPLPPLAEAMVGVDERMDRLKEIQKAGWKTPASHPDLDPKHEALQLEEMLKEIGRSKDVQEESEEFRLKLGEAQGNASMLRALLEGRKAVEDSSTAMARLTASCAECHKTYRDRPGK